MQLYSRLQSGFDEETFVITESVSVYYIETA